MSTALDYSCLLTQWPQEVHIKDKQKLILEGREKRGPPSQTFYKHGNVFFSILDE